MRTTHLVVHQDRNTSTSQDPSKVKKSNSLLSCKPKPQASLIESIKKNRIETASKSNAKLANQSSNRSLKTLKEIVRNIPSQKHMLQPNRPGKENDIKKATIPVKNIRQKITGANVNYIITKTNSCKEQEIKQKRFQPKYYQHSRAGCTEESLLNFSCVLSPAQSLSLRMFEVGRKLGRGRFGDVYMARDIRSGMVLALKVISKKELKESQMESQLLQQIKIQSFIEHPNVLKMYGYFSDGPKIYLLLELATNGCLFKQIRSKQFFEESTASFYLRQVANGVRFLHSHYVIHRDIKPENILNCFNVLKLCDFGWAIYSPIYQRQTFCGTLDYVPPEIVTGDYYDEKVDLWCLGVLCYELCTGRAPFESKSDENETYDKILKVDVEFPLYFSSQLINFIGGILHRDPKRRMTIDQIESHEWMRNYENQTGRMISKEIWDIWLRVSA